MLGATPHPFPFIFPARLQHFGAAWESFAWFRLVGLHCTNSTSSVASSAVLVWQTDAASADTSSSLWSARYHGD